MVIEEKSFVEQRETEMDKKRKKKEKMKKMSQPWHILKVQTESSQGLQKH